MFRRTIALLVAFAATATALVPSALICRCVMSGERMRPACCPEASAPPPTATLSASCCVTEDPPLLEQRAAPEARHASAGVPTLTIALLTAPAVLLPADVATLAAALARGSPVGPRHARLSAILRI